MVFSEKKCGKYYKHTVRHDDLYTTGDARTLISSFPTANKFYNYYRNFPKVGMVYQRCVRKSINLQNCIDNGSCSFRCTLALMYAWFVQCGGLSSLIPFAVSKTLSGERLDTSLLDTLVCQTYQQRNRPMFMWFWQSTILMSQLFTRLGLRGVRLQTLTLRKRPGISSVFHRRHRSFSVLFPMNSGGEAS